MIEKYSHHKFKINTVEDGTFVYQILDAYMFTNEVIESDEWFDTEQEARFAAIGHISKIEDGLDCESDYDVSPTFQIDWEERRKLGE
jgi:hypothetical protein